MNKKYACIVDVETTGLDFENDEVTEIAILSFCYDDDTKKSLGILTAFNQLQQVSKPLTEEIQKLTNLTDELLLGHKINWQVVEAYLNNASFVIAHNAGFDKKFISKHCNLTSQWACSKADIPWAEYGYRSTALNFIACEDGFVNSFAHRALFDCATTYRIIEPKLEILLRNASEPKYDCAAVGAPFSGKDFLRTAGFHWDATNKLWKKTFPESQIPKVLDALQKAYADKPLSSYDHLIKPHVE